MLQPLQFFWNEILYRPSLNLIIFLYSILWNNLGLAIIVIAIIFRLLILPFIKKQTEMTKKMAALGPQLKELQKKYKNNPEKLSMEQLKLYRKVGYNPLGCLTSFLPQILVLFLLGRVIRTVSEGGSINGIYDFIKDMFFGGNGNEVIVNTNFLVFDLTKSYNEIVKEGGSRFSAEPMFYLLLCVLVGVVQYLMSKFTNIIKTSTSTERKDDGKKKKKKNDGEEPSLEEMQQKMISSTMWILPLSTVFFAVNYPTALSVYWIVQSFMLLLQYSILDWDKTKNGVQNVVTIIRKRNIKNEKESV